MPASWLQFRASISIRSPPGRAVHRMPRPSPAGGRSVENYSSLERPRSPRQRPGLGGAEAAEERAQDAPEHLPTLRHVPRVHAAGRRCAVHLLPAEAARHSRQLPLSPSPKPVLRASKRVLGCLHACGLPACLRVCACASVVSAVCACVILGALLSWFAICELGGRALSV
jgi:hypothetical protein